MTQKIVLAGGSGLLGRLLARHLSAKGFEIVVLSRSMGHTEHGKTVQWDGQSLGKSQQQFDGAFAVINLTGRSVNCRYNARNRKEILESRVQSTKAIGEAIGKCVNPPRVWLNASTATIYKHSLDTPMDENAEMAGTPDAKDEFSVEVAMAWEKALWDAKTSGNRKVALRIAMVLADEAGSVFPVLRGLARRGLGGPMGGGQQYVAWIHQEDFCRAIEWILAHDDLDSGVNVAAPTPITNREMMRALRKVCGMPFGLPATRWMLETGAFFMRTETELMLKSRRAVPGKLNANGFKFNFPTFDSAANELEQKLRRQ